MNNNDEVPFQHRAENVYSIKRVIIIGCEGFVGKSASIALKALGIKVIGLSRDDIDLESPLAQSFLSKKIRASDVVVFAAANAPVKNIKQFQSNIRALDHLIQAVEKSYLPQFIYISSDAVYADSQFLLTENSLRASDTLHGLMHLTRETMLINSLLSDNLLIVRPTLIYGAGDPHNGYGPCQFMRLNEKSKPITLFGFGEEKRDFIHISDVGMLISGAVQNRTIGTLNLATGEVNSFLEIAILTQEISKVAPSILYKTRQGPMPHNGFRPFDISNLKVAFPDFAPKLVKEGLELMIRGE